MLHRWQLQTHSPVPANTSTATPAHTPIPGGTPTVTAASTAAPTYTPMITATHSTVPTYTPTVTPTLPPLPTFSPTNTPTESLIPTGTPTVTPTETLIPIGTPGVTPTGTPAYTPIPTGTPELVTINGNPAVGNMVNITVRDNNRNLDASIKETVIVTVVNIVTGESEQAVLTETGINTGIFEGSVGTILGTIAGTTNDGQLNVKSGDSLRVDYTHIEPGTGITETVSYITDVVMPMWTGLALMSVADENGGTVEPGDIVSYKVLITNSSEFDIAGLDFVDTIPLHTNYLKGSMHAPEGSAVVSESPDLKITGIFVPAHSQVLITFRVAVDDTLPLDVTTINNQGTIKYDSNGDGINEGIQLTDGDKTLPGEQPSGVFVPIAPILVALKTANPVHDISGSKTVSSGETLSYEINITNKGRTSASDTVFYDIPDQNTKLISGSVQTNQGMVIRGNTVGNTDIVVSSGGIPAGGKITVRYAVTVNQALPPEISQITNQGRVECNELPVVLTDDPDVEGKSDPTVATILPEVNLFVLNGSGEVYRVGDNEPIVDLKMTGNNAQRFSITPSGKGFLILDHFGRMTPVGDANTSFTGEFYGIDIARDIELTSLGQGAYVLDSFGPIHPSGNAPVFGFPFFETIWYPLTSAVDLELTSSGNGYYVLDTYGNVHTYGDAVSFGNADLELGIARDIELMPDGKGYLILDASGLVHGFGSGRLLAESYQNNPVIYINSAIDLEIHRNKMTGQADGWWTLDIQGNIINVGLASAPIVRHPTGGKLYLSRSRDIS